MKAAGEEEDKRTIRTENSNVTVNSAQCPTVTLNVKWIKLSNQKENG